MSAIQITVGARTGISPCHLADSTRNGSVVHTVASPWLHAEVVDTPELSVFHVNTGDRDTPMHVLFVFGYVVFDGEMCTDNLGADRLLSAWRSDGQRMLHRLDGAFLLVIHDVGAGRTSLVSDPFGSRPIWFAMKSDTICFGDSPQEVADRAGLPLDPDPAWVWSMIKFKRTVGERSSVKGVRGLPPGSIFTCEQGRCETNAWFDFTFTPVLDKKPAEFGAEFLEHVRSTVARTCAQSHRPALLLSGGLDSRLLAAVSPAQMHAMTLCDRVNREVTLARRIAQSMDLHHEVVIRPEDWYPDLVEPSCRLSGGVWLWDQAHFLPLGGREQIPDAILLGYGSDTLFKGKDIGSPDLWEPRLARCEAEELVSEALGILERRPAKVTGAEQVLSVDFARECREEFMKESRLQLDGLIASCTTLPDLWESFWSRNLARGTAFMNLVSLRSFTQERNVFTTVSMRQFYLTLPAELRRSGRLPLLALRAGGFSQLLSIPDANTWLPYTVPSPLHEASSMARRTIARARRKMRSRTGSTDFKSNCSWPHNGRLWLHSEKMAGLMDGFVQGGTYDASRFDRSAVAHCWNAHRQGDADYSGLLDFLGTYGAVFRSEPTHGTVRETA